jgi:hypothetical protein
MPDISSGSRTRPNRCMSAAGSQARKRGQARVQVVQPLLAVDAVVEAELLLEVERLVLALLVLVADDVVRAGDHAARAAGAQAGGDDLGVELLPLRGPAAGLGAWVLVSAALVLFMTPGLAFFYGGMDRGRNVLNMLMMNFYCLLVVPCSGWRSATRWRRCRSRTTSSAGSTPPS